MVVMVAGGCSITDSEDRGIQAQENGNAPIAELLNQPQSLERALAFGRLLENATPADLELYRETFSARKIVPREGELSLFTLHWAETDPEAAYEWSALHSSRLDWAQRAAIFRVWARTDPEGAARRAETVRASTHGRIQCQSAVAEGWLYSGKPGFDLYLAGLDQEVQQDALGNLVELVLTRDGPDRLMEWAEDLRVGGKAKLTTYRKTAYMLGRSSHTHAKEWIDRHSRSGELPNLIKLVANGWATHDGAGMIQWIETLPETRERDWGVEDGFRVWLREDREAAVAWLEAVGEKEWVDPAHLIYASRISNDDALAGIEWAEKIQRQELKERTLGRIVRRWRIRDEPAALAWLDEQTDLTPSLRAKMMANIGEAKR